MLESTPFPQHAAAQASVKSSRSLSNFSDFVRMFSPDRSLCHLFAVVFVLSACSESLNRLLQHVLIPSLGIRLSISAREFRDATPSVTARCSFLAVVAASFSLVFVCN